eukprot:SAG11_NODE_10458_length_830_cov_1.690834_1_plen_67_part_00
MRLDDESIERMPMAAAAHAEVIARPAPATNSSGRDVAPAANADGDRFVDNRMLPPLATEFAPPSVI